jgi:hypothetical protein
MSSAAANVYYTGERRKSPSSRANSTHPNIPTGSAHHSFRVERPLILLTDTGMHYNFASGELDSVKGMVDDRWQKGLKAVEVPKRTCPP